MDLNKYKNLHIWMILPMVLMQLGIFEDYWGDFSDNGWSVHIHYWTGTVWYFFLVVQPYFATHGKLPLHKTNGIVGMFLAGGVCLTAFSMLHRDLENARFSMEMAQRFGPFQPWFFYGVAVVEIVMMIAFGYAVIKSIIHRKQLENHAWWLISTVFIILMPALARGIQNVYVDIYISNWPEINIMIPVYITQLLIIAMLYISAWKYGKLKHPATFIATAVNVFIFFLEPLGRSDAIQFFLTALIKE
jgi:hypothetical protein